MNVVHAVFLICESTLRLLQQGEVPDGSRAQHLKWLDANGYIIICKRGFVLTRKGIAA